LSVRFKPLRHNIFERHGEVRPRLHSARFDAHPLRLHGPAERLTCTSATFGDHRPPDQKGIFGCVLYLFIEHVELRL
jgi:hypothetical protein